MDRVSTDGDGGVRSYQQEDVTRDRVNDTTSKHQSSKNGCATDQRPKRKRLDAGDDIESTYMRRLAKDEAREEKHRQAEKSLKRQKLADTVDTPDAGLSASDQDVTHPPTDLAERHEVEAHDVPQHETMQPSGESNELEKSTRTVFLSNVSTSAIKSKTSKRELLEHLASFLPSLPAGDTQHKVDSIRFRSTAFSSTSIPKKAAFAKKELMDATTKSTNAYAVYSTALAAREAPKRLNGTIVLDRHLRVDGVAHPARADNRRCVFVGNLGFVDDESSLHAAEDEQKERKPREIKQAADVEEGLWRQFGKAGTVESVRVVRDKSTRVGKGIAYVQFLVRPGKSDLSSSNVDPLKDPNAVEAALLFNDKKFPPLLPRTLRVTRAKNIKKTSSYSVSGKQSIKPSKKPGQSPSYDPRSTSNAKTLQGRAGKLLGYAGAAKLTSRDSKSWQGSKTNGNLQRSPESFVFEGYRASSKRVGWQSAVRGVGKKQGKPKTRSSRRGAAFKASGRKKAAA